MRNITLLFLTGVIAASWWYAYFFYHEHEADIAIAVAEVLHDLALPFYITEMSLRTPVTELPLPVYGVSLSDVEDSWGVARSEGRSHEGVDIFASQGTPVFSATDGYVVITDFGYRGGRNVIVLGPGRVHYYYAHFIRIADGITEGTKLTQDTVLGYVGATGNAVGTPPHLHFGVYPKTWEPVNPYGMLTDR